MGTGDLIKPSMKPSKNINDYLEVDELNKFKFK